MEVGDDPPGGADGRSKSTDVGNRGARLRISSILQGQTVSKAIKEGASHLNALQWAAGTGKAFQAVLASLELLPGGPLCVWQRLWDRWRGERGELGSKLGIFPRSK